MKKKYTHIFFDLDNTLWDFEKNSKHAMEITFNQFDLKSRDCKFSDFFETYSKHNKKLWATYRNNKLTKKELIHKRFQNTFDDLGIQGVDPEEMNAFYLSEMPKQKHLIEGALELLQYLNRKSYSLFIITNGFKEVQLRKIESSGLKPFFNKVFISEEIKTPKPGKKIFEYAIKSANARKTNSLMVGDDWEGDILGAVNFGIDAIYFLNDKSSNLEVMNNKNSIIKTTSIIQLKSLL